MVGTELEVRLEFFNAGQNSINRDTVSAFAVLVTACAKAACTGKRRLHNNVVRTARAAYATVAGTIIRHCRRPDGSGKVNEPRVCANDCIDLLDYGGNPFQGIFVKHSDPVADTKSN